MIWTILKNPIKAKKQRKSMSLDKRSLARSGSRQLVKKKLRNLQRAFYPKIPRKMTAGLSTLSRRGDASEMSVARSCAVMF